ncbi:Uncharacterised protein [Staphylococcus aureus]|uniref:hypothetical protein n=1 Tax=Staphylococcus aureus TaxID=1280 RepID=UPI0007698AC9|nr:hypothetical protein [Staphylococcus aureus]CYE13778.1 Uncharacterised protein [Staphylococcus aureus]
MSDNLSLFIDYINDNIIYGSEIKREKLENLFNQFAIKNVEKNIVVNSGLKMLFYGGLKMSFFSGLRLSYI